MDRLSFRKACLNTAKSLLDLYGEPPVILVSGGLYSEAIVLSFLEAGARPHLIHLRLLESEHGSTAPVNRYYTRYADLLAERRNLRLETIDLDISIVKSGEFQNFIIETHAPISMSSLCIFSLLNRSEVLIGNFFDPSLKLTDGVMTPMKRAYEDTLVHFLNRRESKIVPSFMSLNSSIQESFFSDPDVQTFVRLHRSLKMTCFDEFKAFLIDSQFPEIQARQQLPDLPELMGKSL